MSYIVFILVLLLLSVLLVVLGLKKTRTIKELPLPEKSFSKKDIHKDISKDWDNSYKSILTNAWEDRYGIPFKVFKDYCQAKTTVEFYEDNVLTSLGCTGVGGEWNRLIDDGGGKVLRVVYNGCVCGYCELMRSRAIVRSFENLYPSATKNIERYK